MVKKAISKMISTILAEILSKMNVTWIDLVGYSALAINLFSMSQADVKKLRWLSLTANAIYVFYGILLSAMPLIIGCSIAVCLHSYRLYKLYKAK